MPLGNYTELVLRQVFNKLTSDVSVVLLCFRFSFFYFLSVNLRSVRKATRMFGRDANARACVATTAVMKRLFELVHQQPG